MNLLTFLFSFRGDSSAMFLDAMERGDIPTAGYALEDGRVFSGANIDSIDANSLQNALTSSLLRKDFDTAKFLIVLNDNKAYVNLSLEPVLYNSIKTDDLDGLKFLIQNGADVNSISGPNTALMTAVLGGSLEVVKLLVDSGADINAKNQAGSTLYFAKDNIDIAKFLIEKGAEITNEDRVELESSGVIAPKTQTVEELIEPKAEEATGEYYPPYDYYSHTDTSGNNEALVDAVYYYDEG